MSSALNSELPVVPFVLSFGVFSVVKKNDGKADDQAESKSIDEAEYQSTLHQHTNFIRVDAVIQV